MVLNDKLDENITFARSLILDTGIRGIELIEYVQFIGEKGYRVTLIDISR